MITFIFVLILLITLFQTSAQYTSGNVKTFIYIRPLIYSLRRRKKWFVTFKIHYNDLGDVAGFTYNSLKLTK